MSNSPLSTVTLLSPNCNHPRKHAIDRISIHCFVGQVTAKRGCEVFQNPRKGASCNYVVGYDGSIGLCVNEEDRSWCTSNRENDHRAITIETASDNKHPYIVTEKAYAALLDLVTDICKRNGKKKLLWFGDKNKSLAYEPKADEMVLTVHRWFAPKACPGQYLYDRHGEIAEEVTRRLNEEDKPPEPEPVPTAMRVYGTLKDVPVWYQPSVRKVMEAGALAGYDEKDPDTIEDNVINVTEDLCRTMTILDRLGLLDRKE